MRWRGEIREEKSVVDSPVADVEEGMSSRAVLVLSIVCLGWSMFFWIPSFSGSVVSDFSGMSANWFGGLLFIIAVLGFFLYAKKKEDAYLID